MLAALDRLEQHRLELADLRTLAEIRLRRGERLQRFSGVLLLRAPAEFRFEALTAFGTPVLIVAGDGREVTVWEVADERAWLLPATPEANRRWLGLALGSEDLVALLGGRVRPLRDPLAAALLPADALGPSLLLTGAVGQQRIWLHPDTGQPRQVEWTEGKNPARVTFAAGDPSGPPAGLRLAALDGELEVWIGYREPRMNTGFDPGLLRVTLPKHVRIQDLR